jgi:hypothetical protein
MYKLDCIDLPIVPEQATDYYCKHSFKLIAEPEQPDNFEPDHIYKCTPGFLHGLAENSGNRYFKIITCGKEWCPDCGKKNSHPHQRRILRLYDKILPMHATFKETGYLVITIPAGLRHKFMNKEALTDFRNFWRRKLKREGNKMGVTRYHWAGEDGKQWKPHLNILFNSGWIDRETLSKWRRQTAKWFQEYFTLDKPPAPNLWYQYTKDISKVKFWLRYVTRATMLNYSKSAADVINNFRNIAPFGKFPKSELPAESEAATVIKGHEVDAETGEVNKINWQKKWNKIKNKWVPDLLPLPTFMSLSTEIIGAGYWRLQFKDEISPHKEPPNEFTNNFRQRTCINNNIARFEGRKINSY